MPRLELTLSLLAVLGVACADDTTAMTSDTATATAATTTTGDGSTDAPATTTAPGSTGSPTSDTNITTTGTGTTGPDTTSTVTTEPTSTTTTASTTEPATTTTGETTGGPGVCGVEGDSVSAQLLHNGAPGPCGPLEFTGTRISDEKGPSWQLDGCACGEACLIPDPWSFTVQAPPAWLPLLPACPRIVVQRAQGFVGCEFVAVSVWDLQAPGEPAVYHAASGFTPTEAAANELTLTPQSVETCECQGCCKPAELWDLQFTLAGEDITLGEGESGSLAGRDVINFESHDIGLCDAPLDVHWAIRKPA